MKWLVTNTLGGDRYTPYEAWLSELSIRAERVSPGPRVPGVGSYAALLLTGGGDVDPDFYLAPRAAETKDVNRKRDEMERDLVHAFLAARRPVFGVCRGIQILNAIFRGKLIQYVPAYLAALRPAGSLPRSLAPAGEGGLEPHAAVDRRDAVHPVRFVEGTRLARVLDGVTEVNSAHHQAVDPGALGNGLRVSAVSGAGIIEALEGDHPQTPVLAVQWHPERLLFSHPASSNLLRAMREMASG